MHLAVRKLEGEGAHEGVAGEEKNARVVLLYRLRQDESQGVGEGEDEREGEGESDE